MARSLDGTGSAGRNKYIGPGRVVKALEGRQAFDGDLTPPALAVKNGRASHRVPLQRRPTTQEGRTMKGNPKVIEALNDALADELSAINQYMVHSEMCDNWGYERLHKLVEKRAVDEMKHAEKHIGRIIFLEGTPIVTHLKDIHIGADVAAQFRNDLAGETGAVKTYNAAIKLCVDLGDNGTRELLDAILKDEEAHIDWLEAQLDQISQMGIQNYLVEQTG
jgi:bacterioferritin